MNRRVVDEDRVRLLSVLAETLAVVGRQHDESVVEQPFAAQAVEEHPDGPVGARDLPVVRRRGEHGILRERGVRGMRVVEMDPGEERGTRPRRLPPVEPGEEPPGGFGASPIANEEELRRVLRPEIVVVAVEPLRQVVAAAEDHGRHEGLRRVAGRLEPLGQCHRPVAQGVGAVVAHPVGRGRSPVRIEEWEGSVIERRGRVLAADPLPREAVDVGRAREGVAVTAEMVGPERVDRDQEDVGPGPRLAARPGEQQGRRESEEPGEPASSWPNPQKEPHLRTSLWHRAISSLEVVGLVR